jgi:Cytochrome C oxidase subunit II, periplasmic domain
MAISGCGGRQSIFNTASKQSHDIALLWWWMLAAAGVVFFGALALFGVSDIYLIGQTSPPRARTTAMTVEVIGHQWWWEIRYPGTDVVSANEIHIPIDTRVNVVATTDDVIHSLWVPALQRKIDLIPGYRNRIMFDASRVGVYRGSQQAGTDLTEEEAMFALIVLLAILAVFGGLGFAAHILWLVLIAAVVLWLLGWFVGGVEAAAAGRRRWYGRW